MVVALEPEGKGSRPLAPPPEELEVVEVEDMNPASALSHLHETRTNAWIELGDIVHAGGIGARRPEHAGSARERAHSMHHARTKLRRARKHCARAQPRAELHGPHTHDPQRDLTKYDLKVRSQNIVAYLLASYTGTITIS